MACANLNDVTKVLHSGEVKTTTPDETCNKVIDWIKQFANSNDLGAIGIACFGPLSLSRSASDYGFITTTPKPGWPNTDVVGRFRAAFPGIPIGFDTDVNAAAVGELHNGGHGSNIETIAYITVGTGVGVGLVVEGNCVHGYLIIYYVCCFHFCLNFFFKKGVIHPELGHLIPPLSKADVNFKGTYVVTYNDSVVDMK